MTKTIRGMMRAVLYLTVLGCALAKPNGVYHQEYNYKTSASSFKNNELQHKTDDQGYFRKDGDLEGRVRPKIDANSEHSEYVNPNLQYGDYRTGLIGSPNGDLSSYGHMRANVGGYSSNDQAAEGTAFSDRISGARDAYAGYSSSGAYGSSQSYSMSSNLHSTTANIQQQLERSLQNAIQEQRAYGQNNQLTYEEMERELRHNLTNRLNDELINRYGQQSIRGGLSYTITGGRVHSTANYDNQELLDLRRQMENTLLNQLRSQYNQYAGSNSRYVYSTTARPTYNYPTTTYRTYTTVRPQYIDHAEYGGYTPATNRPSLTTIASNVQSQLDQRLNQILEDVQRKYFSSSSSYALTNMDVLLERLRNEFRSNITYFLDEEIRRYYGTQVQREGYMYSVGNNGQSVNQYNYSVRDLENLRAQMERNLIEKLNRDFERYRSSFYQQQQSQSAMSSHASYGYGSTPGYEYYNTPRYVHSTPRYEYSTSHYAYTTPRYDAYSTSRYNIPDSEVEHLQNRPSSNSLTSLMTGAGSNSQHYLISGSGQSGYEMSGASGSLSQLQRQLQMDLSRQLQQALNRGHFGYSSSGGYNPQSYQTSLQQLSDELNRNLTRRMEEYSSSSYYSSSGNVDQSQLASLRNQLQADLMRQLQQGLQQSYQSSSSYSASSSSSSGSFRPVRGFQSQNYQAGQYKTGGHLGLMAGDDCLGDDPNAYTNHRMKRSYQAYRSQPIGLSNTGSNKYYGTYGRNQPQQQAEELGQEEDESDLTQQVQDPTYESFHTDPHGQQIDESDLTQQVEEAGYGKLELDPQSQQQTDLGQQIDDSESIQHVADSGNGSHEQFVYYGQQEENSDLTQQVEDSGYGKLQLDSQQSQKPNKYRQQEDDSDLTQQVEDIGYGSLEVGSQQNQIQTGYGQHEDNSDLTQQTQALQNQRLNGVGQQEDNSDLTQKVEDIGFGKPQRQQQTRSDQQDSDLTQQVEDSGYGKLQLDSQQSQRQTGHGQLEDNSDLTQQVEDIGLGKPSHQQHTGSDQDSDLTQQVVDSGYGKLQLDSQQSQSQTGYGQQIDDSDLTQQVEDSGFGIAQPNQHQTGFAQQEDNSDLTQQVDEFGIGQHNQIQTGFGRQIDNADLTQQVEDSGFGNLHSASQTGQHEDNSDLTQQVQDSGFGGLYSGSQQHPTDSLSGYLQRPYSSYSDFNQQQTNGFGRSQYGSQTQQRRVFDEQQSQTQLTNQLEEKISRQMKEVVQQRFYSSSQSESTDLHNIYDSLISELRRNITREMQQVALGSYSSSYRLNNEQLHKVQEQVESDLKSQLQQEINSVTTNALVQPPQNQESFGQAQVDSSDLTQQTEDDAFSYQKPLSAGQTDSDLTQQVDDDYYLGNNRTNGLPQNQGKAPVESGSSTVDNHITKDPENPSITDEQIDLNQQISGNSNHSNGFIQTEIDQHPDRQLSNGRTPNLPTSNVNQPESSEQFNSQLPSKVEPLSIPTDDTDLPQPTIDQQVTENSQKPVNQVPINPGQQNLASQSSNGQVLGVTSQGQFFSQQQSRLDAERNADVLIDTLRQYQNRPSQSPSQPFNYVYNNRPVAQTTNNAGYPYTAQGVNPYPANTLLSNPTGAVFNDYTSTRQQQKQFAIELRELASRRITSDMNDYNSHGLFSQQSYESSYQQLTKGLRISLNLLRTDLESGVTPYGLNQQQVSIYNTLTTVEKAQFFEELYDDLSTQIQQSLSTYYASQQINRGPVTATQPSAYGYGRNPYTNYNKNLDPPVDYVPTPQVNYGTQSEAHQNIETTSDLKPVDYNQAGVVQNVERPGGYHNAGVKGHRYRPRPISSSQIFGAVPPPVGNIPPPPSAQPAGVPPPASSNIDVNIPQPGNIPPPPAPPQIGRSIPPLQSGDIPHEPPPSEPIDISVEPAVSQTNQNEPNESLPWWKRFGHKVKEGAQSFKEKYIG
ncbi:hypothetical protein NQ317_008565 [Molorchus minor]|uniref:Uncharacterized protein n=1 Tax=Molorchus minor TaxID=1323400 RepID=A0ABQ9JPA6_9CUCU|nr:hypothetical protein NQ317_008565 [Molorchus minor]